MESQHVPIIVDKLRLDLHDQWIQLEKRFYNKLTLVIGGDMEITLSDIISSFSLCCQCITAIIIFVSAIFVIKQINFMRKTIEAQSYGEARRLLQDEKVRQAQRTVFKIRTENKTIDQWTKAEINDAEIVCHTYDCVGQMIRFEYLDKKIILKSLGTFY